MGTTCSLTWIHTTHMLPRQCLCIYTQPGCLELWLGITVIRRVHVVCMIQACHQNDGYYIDTCLTLQVETSYYRGCTATHVIQVHVTEAYTCIWQAHQKQSLAVWRSYFRVSADNIGTTVLWLQACMHLPGHLQTQDNCVSIGWSESGQDCCCIWLQLLCRASMLSVNTSMLVLLTCYGLQGCQEIPSSCCNLLQVSIWCLQGLGFRD